MTEDEFFGNIARRLHRNAPLSIAPARDVVGAPDFWSMYDLTKEERVQKFQVELEKLGGLVSVHDDLPSLHTALRELLGSLSPQKVCAWGGDLPQEFGLDDALTEFSVDYIVGDSQEQGTGEGDQESREAALAMIAQADVGITGCDYAVADTGSVVLVGDVNKVRSISLLPSVHIVLLSAHQIKTRMGQVLSEVAILQKDAVRHAASVNFISGPSRSSDIENDLSIGVHGPASVHALILL